MELDAVVEAEPECLQRMKSEVVELMVLDVAYVAEQVVLDIGEVVQPVTMREVTQENVAETMEDAKEEASFGGV